MKDGKGWNRGKKSSHPTFCLLTDLFQTSFGGRRRDETSDFTLYLNTMDIRGQIKSFCELACWPYVSHHWSSPSPHSSQNKLRPAHKRGDPQTCTVDHLKSQAYPHRTIFLSLNWPNLLTKKTCTHSMCTSWTFFSLLVGSNFPISKGQPISSIHVHALLNLFS